jgi:hypothetical protein
LFYSKQRCQFRLFRNRTRNFFFDAVRGTSPAFLRTSPESRVSIFCIFFTMRKNKQNLEPIFEFSCFLLCCYWMLCGKIVKHGIETPAIRNPRCFSRFPIPYSAIHNAFHLGMIAEGGCREEYRGESNTIPRCSP